MRALAAVALVAVTIAVPAPGSAAADIAQRHSTGSVVTVELNRAVITASPGEIVRFDSAVRNRGGQPLQGLIATLNIISSDPDVYVDPEDWSAHRTQFLDEVPAGGDATLTWQVRAVTSGPLILYVALTEPNTHRVAVSGQLRMSVVGKRQVNPGGVLPLVMGVPAVALFLLAMSGVRRRRQR